MSGAAACTYTELVVQWHQGELDLEEGRRFEAHLDGCAACKAEAALLLGAANELAHSGPEAEPPPELLSRLRERVAAGRRPMPWNVWSDDLVTGEPLLARETAEAWEDTPIPGIEARRLFVDRRQDRVTMMVRMAPGTSFPAHVHNGPEECLVLQGDLTIGPERLAAGDYQYAPAGSSHPIQSTRGGCVLLLTSSLSDERY
jgi:anti-sigma factor ChrR (cupin superfamily)